MSTHAVWTRCRTSAAAPLLPYVALTASLAVALASPPAALADERTESKLQYDLGVQLLARGRVVDALERFLASNRLVPNGGAMANAGACYERLRERESAYNAYRTALGLGLSDEEQAEIVLRRIERLSRRVAVLDVAVEPPDALLYLDRIDLGSVGQGSGPIAVRADAATLIAQRDGYATAEVAIAPTRGETVPVTVALQPIQREVVVTSEPPGAEVVRVADGTVLGQTPFEGTLMPGPHELRLERAGYRSAQRVIDIRAEGTDARWSETLERDPSQWAAIQVGGVPEGARALLDGNQDLGRLPLSHDTLALGTHRLRVTAEGHEPWEGPVVLEGGGNTRVDVRLRDPDTAPRESLLWIGYGTGAALVAAGVGVGIGGRLLRNDLEEDPNPSPSDLDRLDRLNRTADALWITGVVGLVATMIVDLVLREPAPSSAEVDIDR